ncbi:Mitogen-activated protein kinase kinase kinase 17 [Bienertia sinuspersici]
MPRGSPLWMAPEVVRGESQGRESDIWSLGCTVIEMFTGLPAWKDCGAHTLFQIGYSNDLPEFPAQLPELGKDFLKKCLNRNPRQRWSSDQLLQHPFLLPVSLSKTTIDASPRSIFDWPTLVFSPSSSPSSSSTSSSYNDIDEITIKGRIGELATTTGVNWESDGWVEVRAMKNQKDEEDTSSEYSELETGVELEIHNDDYSTWINLTVNDNENEDKDDYDEVSSSNTSVSGVDGVSRCGHGDSYGGVKIEILEPDIIVTLDLLLLLLLILLYSFSRNKNILCKYECYIVILHSLSTFLFSSWNFGASSYITNSNIVYFEFSKKKKKRY